MDLDSIALENVAVDCGSRRRIAVAYVGTSAARLPECNLVYRANSSQRVRIRKNPISQD